MGGASAGVGGTFGSAGVPISEGGFAQGGFVQAGMSSGGQAADQDCPLSNGNCRLPSQVGCDAHPVCEGGLLNHEEFGDGTATVRDIATSQNSGRVAIAGSFSGTISFGGKAQQLISVDPPNNGQTDAFVAAFDAKGNAEWAYALHGSSTQWAAGLRFTPNDELVVQGNWAQPGGVQDQPGVFAVRLGVDGAELWRKLGAAGTVGADAGHVGVDNDGNIVLSGSFATSLRFAGASLTANRAAGYLIKLDGDGQLLWANAVTPENWAISSIRNVAVDDEDNIVVSGAGRLSDNSQAAYLQKLGSNGGVQYTRVFSATSGVDISGIAVDRNMRVFMAAQFTGQLLNEGKTFQSSSNASSDLWLATYSREGVFDWQRVVSGDGTVALLRSATTDPFGNLIVAGIGDRFVLEGKVQSHDVTRSSHAVYTLKLRPDSSTIWVRWFEGISADARVASNNQGDIWLAGDFVGKLWFGDKVLDSTGPSRAYLFELSP
jgi:hypothetical protein